MITLLVGCQSAVREDEGLLEGLTMVPLSTTAMCIIQNRTLIKKSKASMCQTRTIHIKTQKRRFLFT